MCKCCVLLKFQQTQFRDDDLKCSISFRNFLCEYSNIMKFQWHEIFIKNEFKWNKNYWDSIVAHEVVFDLIRMYLKKTLTKIDSWRIELRDNICALIDNIASRLKSKICKKIKKWKNIFRSKFTNHFWHLFFKWLFKNNYCWMIEWKTSLSIT